MQGVTVNAISGRTWLACMLMACLVQLAGSSCRSTWRGLKMQRCLSDSLAMWTRPSSSAPECVFAADKVAGLLVAQFDSDTRRCSLFQYIAVCHLIDGLEAVKSSELSCAAFANARATKFMALSRKLMLNAGPKLRAAWVMSEDAEASRSNLVCGQTQQWMSEAIEWTSEGAKLDGVSSKMWLENVDFANLEQGLTWLVRLKRHPKVATLLESYLCSTYQLGVAFWDGVPSGWGLYFFRQAPSYSEFTTASTTNTFDPHEFVEVGVTSASPGSRDFFSNSHIVPQSSVVQHHEQYASTIPNSNCIRMGYRPNDARMLNGFVRAVAIMNGSMTQAEINHFFSLVR